MGACVTVVLASRPRAVRGDRGDLGLISRELGHWACDIHREGSVPLLIPRAPTRARVTGYREPGIIPRGSGIIP